MTNPEIKQADSLAKEGKSLYQAKKYLPAAASFAKAAEAYNAFGQGIKSAEMRNNQCVALLLGKEPEQALAAVQGTESSFIEAGQMVNGGMALANEATARKDLGESETAIELFGQAAAIFLEAGEDRLYLETMQSVSALKMRSRNISGALFTMQKGLDGLKKPTVSQKILKSLLKIPDQLLNK